MLNEMVEATAQKCDAIQRRRKQRLTKKIAMRGGVKHPVKSGAKGSRTD